MCHASACIVCQRLGSSNLGSLRWTCSCHMERWPSKTSTYCGSLSSMERFKQSRLLYMVLVFHLRIYCVQFTHNILCQEECFASCSVVSSKFITRIFFEKNPYLFNPTLNPSASPPFHWHQPLTLYHYLQTECRASVQCSELKPCLWSVVDLCLDDDEYYFAFSMNLLNVLHRTLAGANTMGR